MKKSRPPSNRHSDNSEYDRAVVTKHRSYAIPADVKGIPIEEYMPNANLPDSLKGAKVFVTARGPVIAKQPPAPSSDKDRILAESFRKANEEKHTQAAKNEQTRKRSRSRTR